MNVRDQMDLLRRENAEMKKVLSDIANMRGREQWDEKNFGSYSVALAARAQMMLDKLERSYQEACDELAASDDTEV